MYCNLANGSLCEVADLLLSLSSPFLDLAIVPEAEDDTEPSDWVK